MQKADNNNSSKKYRIGWVTNDIFNKFRLLRPKLNFLRLEPFSRMRVGWVADYMNRIYTDFHNELYKPHLRYDLVIFQKTMDFRCKGYFRDIKAYGGKVIFDANVNYYEIWGDYDIEGTKPTPLQQRDAIWMTKNCDAVVADSSYLAEVIKKFNKNVVCITDNVNCDIFKAVKTHTERTPLKIIWSGMAKKAQHLLMVKEVFKQLKGYELVVVSDEKPSVMPELASVIRCIYEHFSLKNYVRLLIDSDVIISPKSLTNAYAMGHTEYKITLGMAAGLPVIASPQQSYVEALSYKNSGFIAQTQDDWLKAFTSLSDSCKLRADMGGRARETVLERYSTLVVGDKYTELISDVLGIDKLQETLKQYGM